MTANLGAPRVAVRVYTREQCGACRKLLELLCRKGVAFETIDLTDDDEQRARLQDETGWDTLPMVFVDDVFIGGWDDVEELEKAGQLDLILGG